MPASDVQDVDEMRGAGVGQREAAGADLGGVEQDQIRRRGPYAPAAALWISAHSRLSTSACRLASTMFSLTPMVPHSDDAVARLDQHAGASPRCRWSSR